MSYVLRHTHTLHIGALARDEADGEWRRHEDAAPPDLARAGRFALRRALELWRAGARSICHVMSEHDGDDTCNVRARRRRCITVHCIAFTILQRWRAARAVGHERRGPRPRDAPVRAALPQLAARQPGRARAAAPVRRRRRARLSGGVCTPVAVS